MSVSFGIRGVRPLARNSVRVGTSIVGGREMVRYVERVLCGCCNCLEGLPGFHQEEIVHNYIERGVRAVLKIFSHEEDPWFALHTSMDGMTRGTRTCGALPCHCEILANTLIAFCCRENWIAGQ